MAPTDQQLSKWHESQRVNERDNSAEDNFCVQYNPDQFAVISVTIILGILLLAVAFWNYTIEQAKAQQNESRPKEVQFNEH